MQSVSLCIWSNWESWARKIHGKMWKAHKKSLLESWRRNICYCESYVNGFSSFRTTASHPKENLPKVLELAKSFRSAEINKWRWMVTEVMDCVSVELES